MRDLDNNRLPSYMKLKRSSDFIRVLRDPDIVKKGKGFVLLLKNTINGFPRIGIIASRKTGNAVKRNYFKRICREIFRKNKGLFFGYDVIFIKSSPDVLKYRGMYLQIKKIMEQIK